MASRVFAVGCHPDDIEFMMSGTLMLLKQAGCEIHYMNVANGSCGTNRYDVSTIVRMRREEAQNAAKHVGAIFHESLVNDLEVFYERETLFRLGAVMREVAPQIVLTHSPNEYMEDHSNTCRLVTSAAFCRGMTNFPTIPPMPVTDQEVTLYHAMPYGLRDPLRKRVKAGLFVDVSSVIEEKRKMLAFHKSQKEWLDVSQGLDSYLNTMQELCREAGGFSGCFTYAEGWNRHSHLGFGNEKADPLSKALGQMASINRSFEQDLEK